MIPDRLEPVLAELRPLADRFVAAGHHGVPRRWHRARPAARPRDHRRLRPHDRRAARLRPSGCSSGWADAVWTQGERFGTIGARKGDRSYEITTHRAEAYHAGLAQARRRVRRRDRGRPVSARLHRERDGARPARPAPRRSVRRCARSRRRSLAHAALAGGVVHRRPAADAARRALRRRLRAHARSTHSSTRSASCAAGSRSCRQSGSATSSTSSSPSTIRVPGCGCCVDTGLCDEFLPELPGDAPRAGSDPPSQGRARTHDRGRRERDARARGRELPHRAARRALPRRRQAEDPLVRSAGWSRSTTTRSSARA